MSCLTGCEEYVTKMLEPIGKQSMSGRQYHDNMQRMPRITLGILIIGLVAFLAFPPVAGAASLLITLPGRATTSLPITLIARDQYLGARALTSLVSGNLQLDLTRGRASMRVGSQALTFSAGAPQVRLGDRSLPLTAAPAIRGRHFFLPIEVVPILLSERYGQDAVEWIPEKRVARIRSQDATITQIRTGVHSSHTRIVLETLGLSECSVHQDGNVLRIVVPGGVLAKSIQPRTLRSGMVREVQPVQQAGGAEIRIHRNGGNEGVRTFTLTHPDRIVIDVLAKLAEAAPPAKAAKETDVSPSRPPSAAAPIQNALSQPASDPAGAAREATRSSEGPAERSAHQGETRSRPVVAMEEGTGGGPGRTAGQLTVVLDPGHGGHETGAVGPMGLMEKDIVLDLALRLRRLLTDRIGARVIMTRTEDVFVSLQDRTAVANRARADFFISLHMNGAAKRGAVGFETYYFTREPSDSDARASAQRENLVLEPDGTRGQDQDSLLRIILADMAVTRDMRESSELAEFALTSLDALLKVENRGVKSGPFYVLATAAMPAILIESAFITNPKEERKLQQEVYRQRVAEALYDGIAKYKDRYQRRAGTGGEASATAGS